MTMSFRQFSEFLVDFSGSGPFSLIFGVNTPWHIGFAHAKSQINRCNTLEVITNALCNFSNRGNFRNFPTRHMDDDF